MSAAEFGSRTRAPLRSSHTGVRSPTRTPDGTAASPVRTRSSGSPTAPSRAPATAGAPGIEADRTGRLLGHHGGDAVPLGALLLCRLDDRLAGRHPDGRRPTASSRPLTSVNHDCTTSVPRRMGPCRHGG
ncbi:hypothetical protein O1L55_09265 [Streptomyces albulus]|nr:hypothetical protein [Streptomyces noursei]